MAYPDSRRILAGVGWTFVSAVTVRLMQLAVTVVLARLLVPAEFGLFALAAMIVTALALFRDYGLGQALIYHKTDVQENAETTLLLSGLFGMAAWGAVYAAAPLVALAFASADLVWPLRIMSVSVVFSSLATVPSILLEKELEFRKRAVPEFVMGLAYAGVSIVLAWRGLGIWSLVAGHIASTAAWAVVTWLVAGWKPAISFHRESAQRTLSFGKPLMAASVLFLAFFYLDQAAIGRFLGVQALGYYNLAYTICNLPATNITHVVSKVMYPTYSKLNDDVSAMQRVYSQVVKSIALVSFPVAVWLLLASGDFVPGFFGEKWLPAVPLFRVLAFYGMFRSIGATAGSIFMAVGEPKWVYRLNCVPLAIAVTLVYPVAVKYGTVGVAALFTLAYVTGTSLALWKVVRILGMTVRGYAAMFRNPTLLTFGIVVPSFLIAKLVLPAGTPAAIGSGLIALILYPLAALAVDGGTYRAARSVLSPSSGQVYDAPPEGKRSSKMTPQIVTDLLPKLVNYRLARIGLLPAGRPINITLSVTNMCQSRCKTCSIWEMYRGGRGSACGKLDDELTLQDFERLFRSIGHVYFVNISGGEPFLRKDLPDIIALANEMLTPRVIHIPTNAILPQRIEEMSAEILRSIAASGRRVTFTVKPSFDGVGELHDEIRGVRGNFEKLLDTIERLRRLRDRYPNFEVGAGTVISNFNVTRVRETAAFVHNLGLDSYISEIAEQRSEMFNTEDPITPSADDYEEAIRVFSEDSRRHLSRAGNLGRTTGAFRLVYYDLVVRILRDRRQVLPCYGGISNVHISPYGDVWPCCVLGYHKSMGRLSDFDYNFWKVWRSPRAAEVRSYIRAGKCWCPLANQAYSNLLLSPVTMARVAGIMLPSSRQLSGISSQLTADT